MLGQKSDDPLSPDGTGIMFPVWKQIEIVKQVCTIPCFFKHIPSMNWSGSEFMYIAQGHLNTYQQVVLLEHHYKRG